MDISRNTKKCIVIYRLTIPARVCIAVFKVFFDFDVYYLDMNLQFKNVKIIADLEKKGIKWIKKEYEHFSQYLRSMFDAVEYAEYIYQTVRLSHINTTIDGILVHDESQYKKIDVFWKYYIYRAILPFAEEYAAARFLMNTGKYKRINIIAINSLASFFKRKVRRIYTGSCFSGP